MPTLKLRRIAIVAPGEIGLCEQVFAQLDLPEGHSLSVAHATPPDSLRAVHRKIYGERLDWDAPLVVDKRCIGGIPGNRTTMVVVPIVAAHGMWMPKTSSRAITSPAGTADTMEVLAQVNVEPDKLRQILHQESASSAASTTCNWAHIARLAGAPLDKQAGVDLHKKLGDSVERGDALYTIHAEFLSDFNFAKTAAAKNSGFQLGATTQ